MKQAGRSTAANVASMQHDAGALAKTRLREQGLTLKDWAKQNGFKYATVSQVVRGVNRGTFGDGYRIAVALGLRRA